MFSRIKLTNRRTIYFFITDVLNSPYFIYQRNIYNLNLHSEKPDRQESPYYIENSLRKVYPYHYTHSTHCKGRWIKKNIVDLYLDDFATYPREHIERRVLTGALLVNGRIVGLDYTLKNGDILTSTVHRHELPVLATPIKTIFEDENLLVVDKPPSIPVHPGGMYRYNSVNFLLYERHNQSNLATHHVDMQPEDSKYLLTHRLDRLTSGVLILAKSGEKSRKLHDQIVAREVEKEYLCRVEGDFPNGTVVCDAPLKRCNHRMGASVVDRYGKDCRTEFVKKSFNGRSSVVLCKPKTGRTHQIRVHLQFLGHPIVNDPLYNCFAFGPLKGKGGQIGKTVEQLMKDLVAKHTSDGWLCEKDIDPRQKRGLDPSSEHSQYKDHRLKSHFNPPSNDVPSEDTDPRLKKGNNLPTSDQCANYDVHSQYAKDFVPRLKREFDFPTETYIDPRLKQDTDIHSRYAKDVDPRLKRKLEQRMRIPTRELFASMNYGITDSRLPYRKDPGRLTRQAGCFYCGKSFRDPAPSDLVMFLHALRYRGDGWEFRTEMPGWAHADWDLM